MASSAPGVSEPRRLPVPLSFDHHRRHRRRRRTNLNPARELTEPGARCVASPLSKPSYLIPRTKPVPVSRHVTGIEDPNSLFVCFYFHHHHPLPRLLRSVTARVAFREAQTPRKTKTHRIVPILFLVPQPKSSLLLFFIRTGRSRP